MPMLKRALRALPCAACTAKQAAFRGHLARSELQGERFAAETIQARVRGHLSRGRIRDLERRRAPSWRQHAAVRLQRWFRGALLFLEIEGRRSAATHLEA